MAEKVACIYIGTTPLRLSPAGGPYYDGLGKRLASRDLMPGDTLMMSPEEVNGVTFLHDPRGVEDSEKLGAGKVTKPEHADLAPEALAVIGYDFHEGRSDFITVAQYEAQKAAEAAKAKSAATAAAAPAAPSKPAKSEEAAR